MLEVAEAKQRAGARASGLKAMSAVRPSGRTHAVVERAAGKEDRRRTSADGDSVLFPALGDVT